jgi:single-strand DNA-binding protein
MTSIVTVEGNLTADPRFNYTSSGKAVANLRVAVSSRRKDRDGEYQDTPPVFYDVTVWGTPAEHVADCLHAGDRILVAGTTYVETWTDSAGDQRTKNVLDADAVGVSLRYHTASPVKPTRTTPTAAAAAVDGG